MLKVTAENSAELCHFIEQLDTLHSEPQKRHVLQSADALITTEGRKDLSYLYRHIVGDPCPKLAAAPFRVAPWQAEDARILLHAHLVKTTGELFRYRATVIGVAFVTQLLRILPRSLTTRCSMKPYNQSTAVRPR